MNTPESSRYGKGMLGALRKHKLVDGKWVPTSGEEGGEPKDKAPEDAKAQIASVVAADKSNLASLLLSPKEASWSDAEIDQTMSDLNSGYEDFKYNESRELGHELARRAQNASSALAQQALAMKGGAVKLADELRGLMDGLSDSSEAGKLVEAAYDTVSAYAKKASALAGDQPYASEDDFGSAGAYHGDDGDDGDDGDNSVDLQAVGLSTYADVESYSGDVSSLVQAWDDMTDAISEDLGVEFGEYD